MIAFRSLTKEERQSPRHFCRRCETWQKRFELHHCVASGRWKAAKAVHNVHTDVHFQEPVHFEPVHSTVEEEHSKVDISEVDTVDKVDAEEAVHSSKEDARREYEREYKRKKRAEAKAIESVE
jgi:hypothetical protein